MQKQITEANFRLLLDSLLFKGQRVVGPRRSGGTVLYEPLASASDLVTDELPRRSVKEAFFPVCEDLLEYRKEGQQVQLTDVTAERFPETVLIGVRPCDAPRRTGAGCRLFLGLQGSVSFWNRRAQNPIIGLAPVPARMMPVSAVPSAFLPVIQRSRPDVNPVGRGGLSG